MSEAAQEMIAKTYQELAAASRPKQDSRNWKDPEGYKNLFPWSNAVLLRHLVRILTADLPPREFRRKTQLDDAIRSVVRNMEEGFKRPTTKEYLNFLGFSQASLEEGKGDIRDLADDALLISRPGSSLASIHIDLRSFHEALLRENKGGYGQVGERGFGDKVIESSSQKTELGGVKGGHGGIESDEAGGRGEVNVAAGDTARTIGSMVRRQDDLREKYAYHPLTTLYPPLKSITAKDLSYEIFLELINKTDYLLRLLVKSLETKMNRDGKYYLIEQERIRQKLRGR